MTKALWQTAQAVRLAEIRVKRWRDMTDDEIQIWLDDPAVPDATKNEYIYGYATGQVQRTWTATEEYHRRLGPRSHRDDGCDVQDIAVASICGSHRSKLRTLLERMTV